MLICPQCQFDNPNTNKFCQRCGTSLTYKVCPECGSNVALSDKQCQNCGTATGTVWWAIISKAEPSAPKLAENLVGSDSSPAAIDDTPLTLEATQNSAVVQTLNGDGENTPPQSSPATQNAVATANAPQTPAPSGAYLDPQQRYQLLEPIPPLQEITASEVQVKVLDCQPFQLSPLEASANSEIAMDIPAIAKAYLALQSQPYQTCAAIHDAWQQEGIQVLLIEDRSDWLMVTDLWQDDKTTSLQILHWLYEITQLWPVLEPWRCRQSLLELSNLRVDEDQVLVLQRLYAEPEAGKPLMLQDLGRVWQTLFQKSQRTQLGSLVQLLQELQIGNIQTTDDLRSRLEAIANELQANLHSTAPSALPPPPALFSDTPTIVLPMQLVSLEDAGLTDVGCQRHHNEDYFGIETTINKFKSPKEGAFQARSLYILCDGMGGHAKGEVASALAVKTLQQYFQTHWQQQLPTEDTIRKAVLLANQAIYDVNQQDARSGIGRMGTTLVMVLLQDTQVAVAHVGDSRLYRLTHKQQLELVTVDHEVGQRDISRGVEPEIAYARPDAYQLTQALGPRDENFVIPEVKFLELKEDTLLILTSDGLSDNDLLEQHWHTHLEPLLSSEANLERGVSDLIALANQYNGHDNITAVAIRAQVCPNVEQVSR